MEAVHLLALREAVWQILRKRWLHGRLNEWSGGSTRAPADA
jgi:hypothetical protein